RVLPHGWLYPFYVLNRGPRAPPLPPVPTRRSSDLYEAVNKALKEYAESEPNTEFADVWTPALDADGNVKKDIFVKDNLHLNAKGYQIWQQVLSKYLPEK